MHPPIQHLRREPRPRRSFLLVAVLIPFALLGMTSCEGNEAQYDIPAPPANPGASGTRVQTSSYAPIDQGDGIAAFRTDCARSHYNYDDPIVYPGQANAAHLHAFFGNTSTNHQTTNPRTDGTASTCRGGAANKTAYWVPAMLDITDGDASSHTGNLIVDFYKAYDGDSLQVYYKSGYQGIAPEDVDQIQPFPAGLKMIAGSQMNALALPLGHDGRRDVYWTCQPPDGRINPYATKVGQIPTDCPAGDLVMLTVRFPQCWDGENLDSPNHRDHMAYATLDWDWEGNPIYNGCPESHPVMLPEIEEHFRWVSPGQPALARWRLSSDNPSYPGASAHADWWNGWDPAIMQRWIDTCFQGPVALDCQMNLLGPNAVTGIQEELY